MVAHTDFGQFSHEQLIAMLYAGDPDSVRSAATAWDNAGGALHDRANDLDKQLRSFSDKWEGGAAQQYHTMISDLASGIRKVADTAFDVRDLTYSSAEALDEARRAMPQPVSVPDLPPNTVQIATTPLSSDPGLSPDVQQQLAGRQSAALQQVRDHQKAVTAADGAHQQAVQVMTTLAGHYTSAEQSMPAAPDAAPAPPTTVPTPPSQPTTVPISLPANGVPTNDNVGIPVAVGGGAAIIAASPLFGRMFTAGLAAASAATAGRFGGMLPRIPGFMRNGKKAGDAAGTGPTGARTGGVGGGTGSGGIGGGGGDIGGTGTDDSPTGNPALAGGAPTAASGLTAAGTGAAASAAATRPMGMMPMMPMGAGMGGADMGGGRRIPPWLVETENVWGETAVVAPPVIGEDA